MPANWRIEPLQSCHDRKRFSCGEPKLDNYLAQRAGQNQERGISRTFVLVDKVDAGGVLGYYSLAVGALDRRDYGSPPAEFRHFPNFPLPIVKLARLAVDSSQQGNGIGKNLILDAAFRCLRVAQDVGVAALAVDAKDDRAKAYYLGLPYGFRELPKLPLTLWLLMPALRKLLQDPELEGASEPSLPPRPRLV